MTDRYDAYLDGSGEVMHEKVDDGEYVKFSDYAALLSERDALAAENQKLREALQKCADPHRYHAPCPHCCQTITECGSYIARAALAQKDEGQ